ncbi:hypothetical protein ACLKA6_014922 [Drosophila palustris]
MDFIRPRNGNAALDKTTPFRDQPLDLTTGHRHLYPNATPDRPTVAAIELLISYSLIPMASATAGAYRIESIDNSALTITVCVFRNSTCLWVKFEIKVL